jgi:hypothetical protein
VEAKTVKLTNMSWLFKAICDKEMRHHTRPQLFRAPMCRMMCLTRCHGQSL